MYSHSSFHEYYKILNSKHYTIVLKSTKHQLTNIFMVFTKSLEKIYNIILNTYHSHISEYNNIVCLCSVTSDIINVYYTHRYIYIV